MGPCVALSNYVHDAFHRSERAWNRQCEHTADEIAATINGPLPVANALSKIAIFSTAFSAALQHHKRIDNQKTISTHMAEFLGANGYPPLESLLSMQQAHPYDSHPSLQERLMALKITLTPADYQALCIVQPGQLLKELQLC